MYYADFTIEKRGEGIFYRLETHPAFEVALLGPYRGVETELVLMSRRLDDGSWSRMKFPGGYLRECTTMAGKILTDTGIEINEDSLKPMGQVIGHPEIVTPIRLYAAQDGIWSYVGAPRSGVALHRSTILNAAKLASLGELACDSSHELAMNLYFTYSQQ